MQANVAPQVQDTNMTRQMRHLRALLASGLRGDRVPRAHTACGDGAHATAFGWSSASSARPRSLMAYGFATTPLKPNAS